MTLTVLISIAYVPYSGIQSCLMAGLLLSLNTIGDSKQGYPISSVIIITYSVVKLFTINKRAIRQMGSPE
jgi:hypothetical protein